MLSFVYHRVKVLSLYFIDLPKKIIRFGAHLIPLIELNNKIKVHSIKDWFLDLPFYIFDLLMLPELIEFVILIANPGIKKLNFEQEVLLRQIFDGCVIEDRIWVNNNAKAFTTNLAIAYVISNIVNYRQNIQNSTFIHELVHICQYQKFGSVYISRALRAQLEKNPYDYGGSFGLAKAIAQGKHYLDFNFEQQAQIIEDYYEIMYREDLNESHQIRNTYIFYIKQFKRIYDLG